MNWIVFLITFVFTYVLSSQVIFLFLLRFVGQDRRVSGTKLLILTMGSGGMLIAVLTKTMLALYPHLPKPVYLLSVVFCFGLLLILSRSKLPLLVATWKHVTGRTVRIMYDATVCQKAVCIIAGLVYLTVFIQATGIPILGADQLRHLWRARNTVQTRVGQPAQGIETVDQPQALIRIIKGNHSPTALYTWFFLTNAEPQADWLCRTVAPIQFLYLVILIVYLLWMTGRWQAFWGLMLICTVPFLCLQTIGNSQDTQRIYIFLLSFVWLAHALEKAKPGYFIVWLIFLWSSVFASRANYLAVLFSFIALCVYSILKLPKGRKLLIGLVTLVLSFFLFTDLFNRGSIRPIDPISILDKEHLANNYRTTSGLMNELRASGSDGNILLNAAGHKLLLLNKIFLNLNYFSAIPLLSVVSVLFYLFGYASRETTGNILLCVVGGYLFLVLFHQNRLFMVSSIYRDKIGANQFFLLYDRYILLIVPAMVYFCALFLGALTERIRWNWLAGTVIGSAVIALFIPLSPFLLNNKASKGLDDWKKIFSASEDQKLLSYRGGYTQLIEFINQKTEKSARILTDYHFKLIPYYCRRQTINASVMANKVSGLSEREPVEVYKVLKEYQVDYILPTVKSRLFSYVDHTAIQKVVNDVSLVEVVYEDRHWRMVKLRERPIEILCRPVAVPSSDLSAGGDGARPVNGEPRGLGSGDRWGVHFAGGDSGKARLSLRKAQQGSSVMYTGPGGNRFPPGSYCDGRYGLHPQTTYRLKWTASGSAPALLETAIVSYDENGRADRHYKRQILAANPEEMETSFTVKGEVGGEYRIAFTVRDPVTVWIGDMQLESMSIAGADGEKEAIQTASTGVWFPVRVNSGVDPDGSHLPIEWSAQSGNKVILCGNGDTHPSTGRDAEVVFDQPDGKAWWVYTGRRPVRYAPSSYFDTRLLLPETGADFVRFSLSVKGRGETALYLFWYDESGGYQTRKIGTFFLPSEYNPLVKTVKVPPQAAEMRIAFKMNGHEKKRTQLKIRGLAVEAHHLKMDGKSRSQEWEEVYWTDFASSGQHCHYPDGWGVYSNSKRSVSRWGIAEDRNSGRISLSLDQPDDQYWWLHTGTGKMIDPPQPISEDSPFVGELGSATFRISGSIRGKGHADLYIWWYDANRERKSEFVGPIFLQEDFRAFKRRFTLPSQARSFRVAFRLKSNSGMLSTVSLDTFKLERKQE